MTARVLAVVTVIALLFSLQPTLMQANVQAAPLPIAAGKTVFLDPGHGGPEVGATHYNAATGKVDLIEHELNLKIAHKVRVLLEADGFKVAMSRQGAESANEPSLDRNDDGRITNRDQYQAVVDKANEAKADLFVSIHNNGAGNKDASGTEVWFSPTRAFADKNLLFARLLIANLVSSIRATGYQTVDRGIKDDTNFRVWQGRYYEIFVIGAADNTRFHPRATEMPGALGESLFLSNEADAAQLLKESTLDAIARGYHNAIVQYFETLATGKALEMPVPANPLAMAARPPVAAAPGEPSTPGAADAEAPATPTPAPTPVPVREPQHPVWGYHPVPAE